MDIGIVRCESLKEAKKVAAYSAVDYPFSKVTVSAKINGRAGSYTLRFEYNHTTRAWTPPLSGCKDMTELYPSGGWWISPILTANKLVVTYITDEDGEIISSERNSTVIPGNYSGE